MTAQRNMLVIDRVITDAESTLSVWYWNGLRCVWGLEDQARAPGVKVYGETRIPAGTYEIVLRTEGGMHAKYKSRFGERHKGMLWLLHVPFFEYIYIHPLNRDDESLGCLGPGLRPGPINTDRLTVLESTAAYNKIYDLIVQALDRGERVYAAIRDRDGGVSC